MSCNDVRGLHVLDACSRAGALVPEEVAVLGVDDEDTMCELCSPPLSSVAPNPEGIGYAAAGLLETLMSGQTPVQDRMRQVSVEPEDLPLVRRSPLWIALVSVNRSSLANGRSEDKKP